MNTTIKTLCRFFMFWSAVFVIDPASCASAAGKQNYSFEFDLRYDKQHTAILDYWYGNSREDWWVKATEELVKEGHAFYFENVTEPMMPGGTLYVKWRDTETGKVYEETVDLRHRLPKNIENKSLFLMFKNSQLYVYLVSQDNRPSDMPTNGPDMYASRIVTTIYPDQTKP